MVLESGVVLGLFLALVGFRSYSDPASRKEELLGYPLST